MTTIENTCAGQPSGTTLTVENSASGGDILDTLAGNWKFDTVGARSGVGWRCQQTTAAAWRAYWTIPEADQIVGRYYVTLNTAPSATWVLAPLVNAGFSVADVTMQLNTSSNFVVKNAAGTNLYSSSPVDSATRYRVEVQMDSGTTTSNGTINVQVFEGESTTPLFQTTNSGNTNAGAGSGVVRPGFGLNQSQTVDITISDVKFVTGTLTPIGPAANAAPSVTVGADQTVSPGTVTLTATATDDGTIASLTGAWVTLPDGVSAPTLTGSATGTGTASASLTQTATLTEPGVYAWSATATDDDGATGTDGTVITVQATTVGMASVTDNSGAWTNEGGATDLAAAVSDGSATTYAESPDNPSGAAMTFAAKDYLADSGDITIQFKADGTQAGRSITVELLQGTTVVATTTKTLTTTATAYTYSLTSGENAAVTDRTNLSVRVTAS